MQSIQFFKLASRHAEWLSVRQRVVSANIANASTPKNRAQDVIPFELVLKGSTGMARTHNSHMSGPEVGQNIRKVGALFNQEVGVQLSGNTVGLMDELFKSSEIKYQYELNTSLVNKFNYMMMLAVKG